MFGDNYGYLPIQFPRHSIKVSIGKGYYVSLFNESPLYIDSIIFNNDRSVSINGAAIKQRIFDIDIKEFDSVWKMAYEEASEADKNFEFNGTKSRKSVAFYTKDDNGNDIVRIITVVKCDELNAAICFKIDRDMNSYYSSIESCKDISLVGVNNIDIIPGDEDSTKKCIRFFVREFRL